MSQHESWKKHRRTQYRPIDAGHNHNRFARRRFAPNLHVGSLRYMEGLGTCKVVRTFANHDKARLRSHETGLPLDTVNGSPRPYRRGYQVYYLLLEPIHKPVATQVVQDQPEPCKEAA